MSGFSSAGRALAAWCAIAPVAAWAAVEGPGVNLSFHAARSAERIQADGKLDEAAWSTAPVFDGFVQRFPVAGAPASERTELKVLYDDENLYVAVICHDSQPELINRRLARRDADVFADAVQVMIDPAHNHRTAYFFYLNAGGVQGDGLIYDDRVYTPDWDAVWDGAAGSFAGGWIAEFVIPLHVLRFNEAPVQTWGFGARRDIARKNEEIDSVDNPRTSNATPSRMGHLTGLRGVKPERSLELLPYIAARAVMQPQFSDASRPLPRLMNPSADFGLDLKYQVTSDLALNATLNPDFGQVEADQLIQNLSTFENFFPEKRPFFTQGLELFQPVGSGGGGSVSQQLFYSRRIGLQAPILGAAKMTGSLSNGLEVGALDAVVLSAGNPEATEENPDRRFVVLPERPFHLGPRNELPLRAPPPMNFFAGVARQQVFSNSRVGAIVTSALPLTAECTAEDAALDDHELPSQCLSRGGNAAALDLALNSANSEYGLIAQVNGSQRVGGVPLLVLRDGTALERGELGYGGYARGGKLGGEGLRWDVSVDYSNPTLDLNPSGFQRTQNEQAYSAGLRYHASNGFGALKAMFLNAQGGTRFTTDGRGVNRGSWFNLNGEFQLPSFDVVFFELGGDIAGYNVREIGRTGVPFEQPTNFFAVLGGATNPNRPLRLDGFGAVGWHTPTGAAPTQWGWGARLAAVWRPHHSLETRIEAHDDRTEHGARYIETLDDTRFVFGLLQSNFLSLTFRQSWIITPRLTLQAYAQLFTDYGLYGPFFEGTTNAARAPIHQDELVPVAYARNDSFYNSALNMNVVLRWEYRLGSTLFLVYSRSQQSFPTPDGVAPPRTRAPHDMLRGPASDAFLVKWSYYWSA